MSGDCDRARQWASNELDGELSSFERVLLQAHVARCSDCGEFRSAIGGLTAQLRAEPLEPFEGSIELRRVGRRGRLRLAPAAAAVAVAAVGLGSLLASASIRSGAVDTAGQRRAASAPVLPAVETMNLTTTKAIERRVALRQLLLAPAQRSVSGGPVVNQP